MADHAAAATASVSVDNNVRDIPVEILPIYTSAASPVTFSCAAPCTTSSLSHSFASIPTASALVDTPIADVCKTAAASPSSLFNSEHGQTVLYSSHARRALSQPKTTIIISSAVGGAAILINILLVIIYCVTRRRRARHHPMYRVQPYTERRPFCTLSMQDTPPSSAQPIMDLYTPSPQRIRRSRSFLQEPSPPPQETPTRTTETPAPPPFEVEDVYQHLEALTEQLNTLRVGRKLSEAGLWSKSKVLTRSERIQAGLVVLRTEVDRLKRHSAVSEHRESGRKSSRSADLTDMLHALAGLRAEVESMLIQTERSAAIERLPSYSSRLTSRGYAATKPAPPLPTPPIPLHIKC